MLYGVEAKPLTCNPSVASVTVLFLSLVVSSHPAEPLSPVETITAMPSVAACDHQPLISVLPLVPRLDSHSPKLRLKMSTGELASIAASMPVLRSVEA